MNQFFPELRGEKQLKRKVEFSWNASSLSHYDPRTNQSELEVPRMIHLQNIANQLPDAFIGTKKVTRSHIPAANTPARIIVPEGQFGDVIANESRARLKRGRPIGSKDKVPWKRKEQVKTHGEFKTPEEFGAPEKTTFPEQITDTTKTLDEVQVPENVDNHEISINDVSTEKRWNRDEINVDNIFAYAIALEIMEESEDLEPKSVEECRRRNDWTK